MVTKTKYGFTMIELIIVITVLAILWSLTFIWYGSYVNNATYSNDNTLFNQAAQQMDRTFVKDFAYDWVTNNNHKIRFNLNQGSFDVGTIDSTDNSDLTYAEAWQVFADSFGSSLWLTTLEFDVQVCDRDATDANIDAVLNTKTTSRYYELILFTDSNANGTDCNWTITAWTTQIAGYTFRYKNAKLAWNSSDYDSDQKLDQWTRTSATAMNTAGENVKWLYKSINSNLAVSNKWY
jgi:prepilin-type N-terminal cleavage/methylation domain-containing protein